MTFRLLISLRKLILEKSIYRRARNYFIHRNIIYTKANLPYFKPKPIVKDVNTLQAIVQNIRKYKNIFVLPKIYFPRKFKCPLNLYPGKFLTKGCSAAIISVNNPGYGSQIVLKQPFKFGPEYSKNESIIFNKLSNHPNIIQYFGESYTDICKDPKFCDSCPDVEHYGLTNSVILERMEMNLDELLKTKDLTLIDRIDVLTQILEGQVFLRHKLICHRDLKPQNILVKSSDADNLSFKFPKKYEIKIADFDCALYVNDMVGEKFYNYGTPAYTAPELLNYDNRPIKIDEPCAKSDLWSIGVIAYELFNCENPFLKLSPKNYSVTDLPAITSAPGIIQKLVTNLLHPDPKLRFQSCIVSDILQVFRLKTILTEDVFKLLKSMPSYMLLGCTYMNQMYFSTKRFIEDHKRLEFVLNYVDDD